MTALRDHVYEAWTPDPNEPQAEVRLRLVLRADGSLESAEVVSASSPGAAESGQSALRAGALPALPERARCLAGRRLIATFSTPAPERTRLTVDWRRRVRWSVYGAMLLVFALAAAVLWRATRVHPAVAAPPDAPVPSEGELRRSRTAQWVHLAGIAHLPLLTLREPLWLALVVVVDAVLIAEFLRTRKRPLVRFSLAELVVTGEFARDHRILRGELASWAATATQLGLRTTDGRLVSVALGYLSAQDTRTLLAVVRRMPLVGSSQPPLTVEELQRMQRRRALWILAAALGASTLLAELSLLSG